MPHINGYETAKKIRELQNGKGPVIFAVSAGDMNDEEERSLKAGMDKYFTKPISRTALKESLFYFFKNG